MSINTSFPPRFHMPSSHTFSITIPLSPSIHLPLDVVGTPTIRTLGGAPTIPAAAKRSHYHLAILIHHHHNNEYNINTHYKRNTVSATHIPGIFISSLHPNKSDNQLFRIPFFSIHFFSNPF